MQSLWASTDYQQNLCTWVLRLLPNLSPSFNELFANNMSIESGIYPDEWKVAKVVPIHRKGSIQDPGNFRPISILSTLLKLLERHIHQTFYSYLNGLNIIRVARSSFKNLFSCETALINKVNNWVTAIDNDSMCRVILLDLQKASDLIDHNILLQKLEIYKYSCKTMKLFRSYLNY